MRKTLFTLSIFTACIMAGCGENKKAADAGAETKKDSGAVKVEETVEVELDSAAKAKAWMDYMTPGDMQKWLAGHAGKWNGEVTMWMEPGAEPQKTTQTAEIKMLFNGMYQEGIYKGDFGGMPFEGRSTIAFDNAKKEFQSTWIDNMGSGIMMMTGKYDEASKTLTMEGMGVNPETGKEEKMREVTKFPDENTQIMEMYCEKKGKEEKIMEIKLTRK